MQQDAGANGEEETYKVDEPLLRTGENKIKFDVIDQGLGSNSYRLSLHTGGAMRIFSQGPHMQVGASLQTNVLPFDPSSVRYGFAATFIC